MSVSDVTWGLKGGISCGGGKWFLHSAHLKCHVVLGPMRPPYFFLHYILPVDGGEEFVAHHVFGVVRPASQSVNESDNAKVTAY